MSEENQNPPALIEEPITDLSSKDMALVTKFMDEGLQGIGVVDDKILARSLDMYLSGRTHRQISTTLALPKPIILYLAYKFNWFQLRQEYIADLEENIRAKVMESKIMNQDFIVLLQQMWRKKIGKNVEKYLATDSLEYANAIDLKEIDKYLKTVEILHRLSGEKAPNDNSQRPMIGLNAGDGVTIVKKGDNEVEITPKSKAIGEALKEFADMKRQEKKK